MRYALSSKAVKGEVRSRGRLHGHTTVGLGKADCHPKYSPAVAKMVLCLRRFVGNIEHSMSRSG